MSDGERERGGADDGGGKSDSGGDEPAADNEPSPETDGGREHTRELSALLSSAALVMAGGMVGSAVTLAERVIIGRLLTPAAYGEVSIGLAVFTLTSTLALAGCSQGISRFVPRYETAEDQRGVWVSGLAITWGLSISVALVLFAGSETIAGILFETEAAVTLLRVLAAALPFVVGFQIAVAAIRGYENTVYRTIAHDLVDPLMRIGLIALLLLAGMGIVAAGIAYLLAAVATFIVAHLLLHRLMPLWGSYRTHTRELVIFSAPLVVSSIVGTLLTRTDTVMLGYFRSSFEVGMYDAAYPLASGLLVVLTAFGFLYLPMASRLDSDGNREAVDDIYATTTKWVYIVTFPAFLLFAVFPESVIAIFFGPEYSDAARVLPILAVGFFASAAVGRDRETLSALGSTSWIAIGNLAGLVLNIVINLLLIPRYGFMGAGVASVISLVGVHGVICSVLWLEYDITPLSPEAIRTYAALPVVLLPWGILLSSWIPITALTLLPFLVITGLCSIAVVGLAGGFEPDDVVIVDLLEDAAGVTIPVIRRFIPETRSEGAMTAD